MFKVSRFINSTWEGLKISLSALGINKTRSILTTLCIIIGIVMVTLMNAVSNGMDAEFDKSMASLNILFGAVGPTCFPGHEGVFIAGVTDRYFDTAGLDIETGPVDRNRSGYSYLGGTDRFFWYVRNRSFIWSVSRL